MNKICYGCGLKLQGEFSDKPGYIPQSKNDSPYCQRCFKIINYGENKNINLPKESKKIIKEINNDDKFVIFLTDFLSLNTEVINLFKSIKKDKLLLISKYDIIPKSIKEKTIINYLKNYYKIASDIKFISSKKNYKVDELINYLSKKRINYTYMVGLSNSGKSSLINKLIDLKKLKLNKVTTSNIPNTTMNFIRVKLNDNLTIIDSPGFIINSYYNDNIIKKPIKPITYQMKKNETLKIEDLYLNFSENTSVTLYLGSNLNIKKYYKNINFNDEINIESNSDLIIKGMGFLNIKNRCNIKFHNLLNYEIRESIFGVNYE